MAGSYAAKYMATTKSPGVLGVITVGADGFEWAPNSPGAVPKLNVKYKTLTNLRASKEGSSKKAMLNLVESANVQYFFDFRNFDDRDKCRNFLAAFVPSGQPAVASQGDKQAPTAVDKKRKQPPTSDSQASSSTARPNATAQAATAKKQVMISDNQASTSTSQVPRGLSDAEIKRRMKMLQENSELQLLHKQLVSKGALSEEEFWAARKRSEAREQSTGWRSDMIAEMRGDVDGRANTVSFQLTPEIIHQIFLEKPAVHKAFLDYVPSRMTEEDFWKKYFRAEFLHKKNDAMARAEADVDEDLVVFLNDDQYISKEAGRKIRRVDPTLDMASDAADYVALPGHGIFRDGTKEPDAVSAKNRLTRLINRHAQVVLAGRQNLQVESRDTMSVARALATNQEQISAAEVDDPQREERIQSMTELEDLHGSHGPAAMPLSIQDPRKYFDVQSSSTGTSCSSMQDPKAALERFRKQVRDCRSIDFHVSTKTMEKVLSELTQAISTAKHPLGRIAEKNVLDVLPRKVRDQLLEYSSTIDELLRHFWATYPITSNAFRQKATRLKDVIQKLYTDVQDMKNSTQAAHRHQVSLILQPMIQTMDDALAHYESELNRGGLEQQEQQQQQQHSFRMAAAR